MHSAMNQAYATRYSGSVPGACLRISHVAGKFRTSRRGGSLREGLEETLTAMRLDSP